MHTHIENNRKNKIQVAANVGSQKQDGSEAAFQFVDERPEAVAQRKLQEAMDKSHRVKQFKRLQEMARE